MNHVLSTITAALSDRYRLEREVWEWLATRARAR